MTPKELEDLNRKVIESLGYVAMVQHKEVKGDFIGDKPVQVENMYYYIRVDALNGQESEFLSRDKFKPAERIEDAFKLLNDWPGGYDFYKRPGLSTDQEYRAFLNHHDPVTGLIKAQWVGNGETASIAICNAWLAYKQRH